MNSALVDCVLTVPLDPGVYVPAVERLTVTVRLVLQVQWICQCLYLQRIKPTQQFQIVVATGTCSGRPSEGPVSRGKVSQAMDYV